MSVKYTSPDFSLLIQIIYGVLLIRLSTDILLQWRIHNGIVVPNEIQAMFSL